MKERKPRTPDEVRAEVASQVETVLERPEAFSLTRDEAQRQHALRAQLMEAALALEPGARLDLQTAVGFDTLDEADKRLAVAALMHLMAGIRLIDWVFTHEVLGALPMAVVREMLDAESEAVVHEGVTLTKDTVHIEWRRQPL